MSAEAWTLIRPGEIIEFAMGFKVAGLIVVCGEGTILELDSVQIEGRKKTSALEFARGARFAPAERFV